MSYLPLQASTLATRLNDLNSSASSSTALSSPISLLIKAQSNLNHLIEAGNIDARPSRQQHAAARVGSCLACRSSKSKCDGIPGVTCSRCSTSETECFYPTFAKRGRKRMMTPNMLLLESIQRDVETALQLISTGATQSSSISSQSWTGSRSCSLAPTSSAVPPDIRLKEKIIVPDTESDDEDSEESPDSSAGLETVIESPLAILAHISSLKIGQNVTLGKPPDDISATQPSNDPSHIMDYFSFGLYSTLSDADLAYDPVHAGILSELDFKRLVNLYFDRLHQYCLLFNPELHTPQFFRATSPFLTTALAFTAASFCPLSRHMLPALFNHMMALSDRIFHDGMKSSEIVQAYCLLVHWAPIELSWTRDRRWGWLGHGIRIATEIRLDLPQDAVALRDQYGHLGSLINENSLRLLSADRSRTWALLVATELAFCVSTGRLRTIVGLNIEGPRPKVPVCSLQHPDYNFYALDALNRIYSKALASSTRIQEDENISAMEKRDVFNRGWLADLEEWQKLWGKSDRYLKLTYQHNCTILLSVSLRFKGPSQIILEECKSAALLTIQLAADWPSDQARHINNFMVVIMAYSATLLLRLEKLSTPPGKPSVDGKQLRQLCQRASDTLHQAGASRPATRTLAGLHSSRVRLLLHRLEFEEKKLTGINSETSQGCVDRSMEGENQIQGCGESSLYQGFQANPDLDSPPNLDMMFTNYQILSGADTHELDSWMFVNGNGDWNTPKADLELHPGGWAW